MLYCLETLRVILVWQPRFLGHLRTWGTGPEFRILPELGKLCNDPRRNKACKPQTETALGNEGGLRVEGVFYFSVSSNVASGFIPSSSARL